MSFDVEYVIKHATNVEKWTLLSGMSPLIEPVQALTRFRRRLLAYGCIGPVQRPKDALQ